MAPTAVPSDVPTAQPTEAPTVPVTEKKSLATPPPTGAPSLEPTMTMQPTSAQPTALPTASPTSQPTAQAEPEPEPEAEAEPEAVLAEPEANASGTLSSNISSAASTPVTVLVTLILSGISPEVWNTTNFKATFKEGLAVVYNVDTQQITLSDAVFTTARRLGELNSSGTTVTVDVWIAETETKVAALIARCAATTTAAATSAIIEAVAAGVAAGELPQSVDSSAVAVLALSIYADSSAMAAEAQQAPLVASTPTPDPTAAPTEVPSTEAPTEVPSTEAPTEVPSAEVPAEVPAATAAPTEAPAPPFVHPGPDSLVGTGGVASVQQAEQVEPAGYPEQAAGAPRTDNSTGIHDPDNPGNVVDIFGLQLALVPLISVCLGAFVLALAAVVLLGRKCCGGSADLPQPAKPQAQTPAAGGAGDAGDEEEGAITWATAGGPGCLPGMEKVAGPPLAASGMTVEQEDRAMAAERLRAKQKAYKGNISKDLAKQDTERAAAQKEAAKAAKRAYREKMKQKVGNAAQTTGDDELDTQLELPGAARKRSYMCAESFERGPSHGPGRHLSLAFEKQREMALVGRRQTAPALAGGRPLTEAGQRRMSAPRKKLMI